MIDWLMSGLKKKKIWQGFKLTLSVFAGFLSQQLGETNTPVVLLEPVYFFSQSRRDPSSVSFTVLLCHFVLVSTRLHKLKILTYSLTFDSGTAYDINHCDSNKWRG